MVKQKQTQKVVINIGEAKPKRRRRAPAKKAPKAGTQPRAGGGGGGGGGVPPPLSQPSDFFPRGPPTIILPNRAGPAVEPTSSLQQLVKPLEQALLLLRPPTQPVPQALPAPMEAEGKEERIPKQLTMQDVRDYMMRQFEQLPVYREEPPESYASTPSVIASGQVTPNLFNPPSKSLIEYLSEMTEVSEKQTQTEEKYFKELPSTGTQVQIAEPEPALIQAGQRPLVDAVVQPSEAAQAAVSKESVEFPVLEYTKDDIRQLDREQKIDQQFLNSFVVKKKAVGKRGAGQSNIDLLDIGRALGLRFEAAAQGAPKQEIIDFILQNKGDPFKAPTFYRK